MGKMKSYRDQTRTGLIMSEVDLGELYCYLELFHKTYISNEEKVLDVMKTIRELYSLQEGIKEEDVVFRFLGNPRNAGRKTRITDEERKTIKALSKAGYSIRSIAKETGISKSSVQRILG